MTGPFVETLLQQPATRGRNPMMYSQRVQAVVNALASIVGADGKILMDVLPQNLSDALGAMVAAQQESNDRLKDVAELLFKIYVVTDPALEQKELPENAT